MKPSLHVYGGVCDLCVRPSVLGRPSLSYDRKTTGFPACNSLTVPSCKSKEREDSGNVDKTLSIFISPSLSLFLFLCLLNLVRRDKNPVIRARLTFFCHIRLQIVTNRYCSWHLSIALHLHERSSVVLHAHIRLPFHARVRLCRPWRLRV